jgi:uncharacterized protein YndB with AHSA1/START domain
MTDIRIVREYPHKAQKVWRALTEPELIALWGMRPEGFEAVVGNRFKFVAKPNPGWRGFVECEILEATKPTSSSSGVLSYSWIGDNDGSKTIVTFTLEPTNTGDSGDSTRLVFEHSGFTGVSGFLLAKLMMGPGWKKMLADAFPTVLTNTDATGTLNPTHNLKPRFPPQRPSSDRNAPSP